MNVIGSRPDGWWKDRDAAMRAFATAVDDHARATGKDITVVFDHPLSIGLPSGAAISAAKPRPENQDQQTQSDPGPLPETSHIDIVIARRSGANAAYHEIEELVAGADDPARLRVVTSDRALIDKVTSLGANAISSGTFRDELNRYV